MRRSARTRRGEEERDAQPVKLRELADGVEDGAGELVVGQVPANVCAAQAVKECEGGSTKERERGECVPSVLCNDWTSLVRVARSYIITQAVKEVNAVRLRREAVERRRTHIYVSAVSWPMESGMGPVSWLPATTS